MKKGKYLILIVLASSITLNLNGGYWSKKIDFDNEQIIFEEKSGCLLNFGWDFAIIDLTGYVYTRGMFKESERFRLTKTIILEDESFCSFGQLYENGQVTNRYTILRFNRNGDILFSKELKLDEEDLKLIGLLQINNKIKIIGRYEEENIADYMVIFTFSINGDLQSSKIFDTYGNYHVNQYDLTSWCNCVKMDSNHYGIITSGWFGKGNDYYHGILFLELNTNDVVTRSKWYYIDTNIRDCWYFNSLIKKDTNGEFSIFSEADYGQSEKYRYRFFFLKLDKNWNLEWSKRYTPEWEYEGMWPFDFFKDKNGYTIGINKNYKINDEWRNRPLLFKINDNGSILWCKTFNFEDYKSQLIEGLTTIPNGGLVLNINWGHVSILNQNGEVPGGCPVYERVSMKEDQVKFYEESWGSGNIVLSNLNASVVDNDITLATLGCGGVIKTFCEYPTIEGEGATIEERSLFGGYYIHKINFSIDSMILPYISKFKIYRGTGGVYDFVSDIVKVGGKTDYEVEFKPVYSGASTYRIVAVNSEDEVVDIGVIYSSLD